jgi:hypothetical protein
LSKSRYDWAKFLWRDWLIDSAVRSCTPEERGVAFDDLCFMGSEEPIGYLENNQELLKVRARFVGVSAEKLARIEQVLVKKQVFSVDETGRIYSRRMVRDYEKWLENKENGKLGGNPQVKAGVNPPVNQPVKAKNIEYINKNKDKDVSDKIPDPIFVELAHLIKDGILSWKKDHKPFSDTTIYKWAEVIRLMVTVDKRDPDQIRKVIKWLYTEGCYGDYPFVVESADSLRKKFDKIEIRMNRGRSSEPSELQRRLEQQRQVQSKEFEV